MQFTFHHIVWLVAWSALAWVLFELLDTKYLRIPGLPLSLVGIAVSFYLGFKNNSSYDRMWEARKIWGAIVNSSRSWGTMVKHFANNTFRQNDLSALQLQEIHQRLMYRHIAWLYTLRHQLLIPTPWEHSQTWMTANITEKRTNRLMEPFEFPELDEILPTLLPKENVKEVLAFKNSATQLIDQQGADLEQLRKDNIIDDFRHMEMQRCLNDFYVHQGKCERIKKFPFPRQYASSSYYFVGIFILLLPFGILSEFEKIWPDMLWLSIPFTVVIAWVFLMMELVGDYSENPFESMSNDIPMFSLCRTIEIDLREMLGETDLPPGIESKNGVLM